MQRSTWRQVAVVAAIVGAGVSAYLLVEYLNGSGGICLTGSGCDEVRLSAFAYPLGIPMPLFGLVFYLVAAWTAWRTIDPAPIVGMPSRAALLLLGIIGVGVSAFLTGVEAFVIHSFCTWCLAQALASLVLFVAAIGAWTAGDEALPARSEGSRRAQRRAAREVDSQRASLRRSAVYASSAMAILVAGLLLGNALGHASTNVPTASGSASLAPESAPREGSGPVTVVEFSDFQCPACAAVSPELQQLVDDGSITLVYRYFPLPQHQNAVLAARAAAAAQIQGKFWPMHDSLFSTQTSWENLSNDQALQYFTNLATSAGLDISTWKADVSGSAVRDAVQADYDAAGGLQLPGTPSIFINGKAYNGSLSVSALRSAVTAAAGG
jgi:protein-disulfide isomerase